jgi:hypothetical protein
LGLDLLRTVRSDFLLHSLVVFLYWAATLGEVNEEIRCLKNIGVVYPSLRLSFVGKTGNRFVCSILILLVTGRF